MIIIIDTNIVLDVLVHRAPFFAESELVFEDCVQYVTGKNITADYIVTRNTGDFSVGSIKAITPKDFLDIIAPE